MSRISRWLVLSCLVVAASGCMRLGSGSTTPSGRTGLEPTRDYLIANRPEDGGYGLYSYLIIGARPNGYEQEARCLAAIKAYLSIPTVQQSGAYAPRWQLNLTYVPVMQAPPFDVSGASPGYVADSNSLDRAAAWILQNYDYARAQHLLAVIRSNQLSGPYLVSFKRPLTAEPVVTSQFLFQDMSRVEPAVVPMWTTEFLRLGAQARYWEHDSLRDWSNTLRNTLAQAASVWPQFANAVELLVQYVDVPEPKVARR
jgi:hypothetical protein